ncbi:MAG: universal stress protein, partial [Terriglobia bacterium]
MSESAFPRPRGALRIYLGYAAGVGKTFKMLEEGHKLKHEGADVVIGYFE